MGLLVGIDLGTTNSLVAIHRGHEASVIPIAPGELHLPSAVALDPVEGLVLGRRAREGAGRRPEATILSVKRHMGTDRTFRLGDEEFRAQDVSALILKELRRAAEAHLRAPVDRAVISVPAYFNDVQRRATREAGEIAGFKVERLINEPTAAALAYGIDRLEKEEFLLVFDLGGGTFDVTVLEMFEGLFNVRASGGESRLGGDDLDSLLVDWILERAAPALRRDRLSPSALAVLRLRAEEAKIALSTEAESRIELGALPLEGGGRQEISIAIRRADLDALAAPLLQRAEECIRRTLAEARLPRERIGEVILVGGPTRMPLVRDRLASIFGRPPRHTVDPMQAVALGAAVQASLLQASGMPGEILVTDVSPFTLGVSVLGEFAGGYRPGVFDPLIQRNSPLPARRSKIYSTVHPEQDTIRIEVYQGDDPLVENNVFLDRYYLGGIPRGQEGQAVEITFRYDEDGILRVEALVRSTGKSAGIRIDPDKMKAVGQSIAVAAGKVEQLWQDGRIAGALLELLPRVEERLRSMPADGKQVAERLLREARAALAKKDRARMDALRAELALFLTGRDGIEADGA